MPTHFDDQPSGETSAPSAGTAFLDAFKDVNPFDTAQVTAFKEGAEKMKDTAQQGGFAINEEGGLAYIKACNTFLDGYDDIRGRLDQLARRPKVGTGPYADKLANHWLKVMDGDEQSLRPNLLDMRDGYEAFREAIEIARRNYKETESAHDQYFGKINPE